MKVSRSLKELSLKTTREREIFVIKEGREPTVSELAKILSVSDLEVTEALCAAAPVISLTAGEDEGGGQTDVPVDSPEEQITEKLSVIKAVSDLDERDRKIIKLRYYENQTLTQTAKVLGMTQVQAAFTFKVFAMIGLIDFSFQPFTFSLRPAIKASPEDNSLFRMAQQAKEEHDGVYGL